MRAVLILLTWASLAHAQPLKDLFDHVYWQAWGRSGQEWSYMGLTHVGRINDTIQHALVIGDANGARFCLNRYPFDTSAVFVFPGFDATPAHFTNSGHLDFLAAKQGANFQRVFLGTEKLDSFISTLVFNGNDTGSAGFSGFVSLRTELVYDVDGDGYDDIVWSNPWYQNDKGTQVGALFLTRGGPTMSTVPDDRRIGTDDSRGHVGGCVFIGKFRDSVTRYLAEVRTNGWTPGWNSAYDSFFVYLYPLGPNFRLGPTDSMMFLIDTLTYGGMSGWNNISAVDITGDGIDDILVESFNFKQYNATHTGDGLVLGFECGKQTTTYPTHVFRGPPDRLEQGFGDRVIDVGDVCGKGYHSILICAENADVQSIFNGAVFLYNTGKGYTGDCVAWAHGTGIPNTFFGQNAIATGDLNGDSLPDFAVGSCDYTLDGLGLVNGRFVVFLGDTSYATPNVGIAEVQPPFDASLTVYPNPCTSTLCVRASTSTGGEAGPVFLEDMLGRIVRRSSTLPAGVTAVLRTDDLPSGSYFVTFVGHHELRRLVIKTN